MRNKTRNLEEYRKNYYIKNKVHMNNYQKWYSAYKKYLKNEISIEEVPEKPKKKRIVNSNPKTQQTYFETGKYVIHFD